MVSSEVSRSVPASIHEHLELSLYVVQKAPYRWLHLIDTEYAHWIISYVLDGDVETITKGEKWRVKSGDVMVHPPHLPFSETASVAGTHLWMMLDVAISPNIDLFRLYPVAPVITISDSLAFSQTFKALLHAWTDSMSPFRNLLTTALTMQLCNIVLESWRQAGKLPRPVTLMTPQDRFIDVIAYMAEHLDQKLSRDELASMVHLHPGYFDRIFHSIYGMAPMQMLRDLRLRRALQLLETTDVPLTAIACSCGLGDAAYFSRVFRQRYGQTPGHYRLSAKSTTASYIPPL